MKPLIAITVREVVSEKEFWAPTLHGQHHTYADSIVRAGGAPFVLPLVHDEQVLRRLYEQCDGLLLTGGSDVDPSVYGEPDSARKKIPKGGLQEMPVSKRRDKQEIQLLRWALEDDKPVLGICRGMQLINVSLGGNLYHDLSVEMPASHNHEVGYHKQDFRHLSHLLNIEPDSLLAKVLENDKIPTNSLHHQGIKQVGKGLKACAHAEDGVIEAIELPGKLFVIGVQSHPEALEYDTEPRWRKLFKAFVKSSAKAS